MQTNEATLEQYLADPLRVGEPDVVGPLAVFPLLGPEPKQDYVAFSRARESGVTITELETGASVNDLVVNNPTDVPVLLYEGEEVLGAQQNRTFDVSALLAAGAKARVPVSCVEVGRWDASRHLEDFVPAPQTAYPELRRTKARHVRERVAAGLEARADQSAVWADVAAKSSRHGAHSDTGAMSDIFEQRRGRLREIQQGVTRRDRQVGMLVAFGGTLSVLDFVSRSSVFEALHGPLVQGYALDALEAKDTDPPSVDAAEAFIARVTGAGTAERDGISLGREIRFADEDVAGSGLVAGRELVQLTAFEGDGETDAPHRVSIRAAAIRRPSHRRR